MQSHTHTHHTHKQFDVDQNHFRLHNFSIDYRFMYTFNRIKSLTWHSFQSTLQYGQHICWFGFFLLLTALSTLSFPMRIFLSFSSISLRGIFFRHRRSFSKRVMNIRSGIDFVYFHECSMCVQTFATEKHWAFCRS